MEKNFVFRQYHLSKTIRQGEMSDFVKVLKATVEGGRADVRPPSFSISGLLAFLED
jgi:hypothetical protein